MTLPFQALKGVRIAGVGAYAPPTVLSNHDLEKMVETSDEWITSRTGIKERRIVSGDQTVLELATRAAQDALISAGVTGEAIDLIVVATSTPDQIYPFVSSNLQVAIGAHRAAAFDVSHGCTGFVTCLIIAQQFLRTGMYKNALVVGADIHSRYVDWNDRNTCILFGDGAGACVVTASEDGDSFLANEMQVDGARGHFLSMGLSGNPQNCPTVPAKSQTNDSFIRMNGKEVFKFAVEAVPRTLANVITQAGYTAQDIDWIILHQANVRIMNAIAERFHIPVERMIMNIDRYGNTSSASIPLALNEAVLDGRIKPGDKIAMCGYGVGLAWATTLVEWTAVDRRLTGAAQTSAAQPQMVGG